MSFFEYQQFLLNLADKTGFAGLKQREKYLVAVSVFVIVFFIVIQFVVEPLLETRKQLTEVIGRKEQDLVAMKVMSKEYLSLKTRAGGVRGMLAKRPANFSLFSFLDQQATKTKVKGQVKYMKPSLIEVDDTLQESIVEIKLDKITLRQLVNFLKIIEPKKYVVVVKRLSIQENGKENGYLDAVLQVMTFVVKNG